MRVLVRPLSFVLGATAATLLFGVLDDTFPGVWLALVMGTAISFIVACQPWMRRSGLAFPFCMSVTFGTSLTYSLSTTAVTTRIGPVLPTIVLGLETVLFAVPLLAFLSRGLKGREHRAMTVCLFVPIAAGCVLGYVSGGIGGSDHMVGWALKTGFFSKEFAELLIHYMRKGIHLSAYGILGLSLYRAASNGGSSRGGGAVFALIMVLCFASFDELRQTNASNRTGSAWDVALDMAGATLFILPALFARRTPRKVATKTQGTTR